jgi:hypothetical protein
MPRMNGVEATRQLKTRWPDLPVIVLTMHDDPVYERTARAAGADRFLLKKTAGIALWPALVSLVLRSGPPTPRAMVTPCPRVTPPPGSAGPWVGKIPHGRSGINPIGGRVWPAIAQWGDEARIPGYWYCDAWPQLTVRGGRPGG